MALFCLWIRNISYRRHCFPGQQVAFDALVPSGVASGQPKEWLERNGLTKHFGHWQLQNRLDDAA
jgi:hypothetical protein